MNDELLLKAWTPERYIGSFPPYINITMTRHRGGVCLTVRAPCTDFHGPQGKVESIHFAPEVWEAFVLMIDHANTVYQGADDLDSIV